jgi:hypothetical protein
LRARLIVRVYGFALKTADGGKVPSRLEICICVGRRAPVQCVRWRIAVKGCDELRRARTATAARSYNDRSERCGARSTIDRARAWRSTHSKWRKPQNTMSVQSKKEQIHELRERGFVIARGLVPPERCAELKAIG